MKLKSLVGPTLVALAAIQGGCAGKKGGDTPKEEEAAGGGDADGPGAMQAGTLGLASEFSASYPEGLSVTAFPLAVDDAPGVAAAGTVAVATAAQLVEVCPPPPQPMTPGCTPPEPPPGGEGPGASGGSSGEFEPFKRHPKEHLKDSQDRLNGTASSCFDEDIVAAIHRQTREEDGCFGFDYGIVSGTALGDVNPGRVNDALRDLSDQSLSGVRSAILAIDGLTPDSSSEACMVKVGRQMVDKAASRVEGVLRVFEGMLCQAKKDAVAEGLPAAGQTLDLKAVFASYPNAEFSEATVARLEDRDGRAVYRSKLVFSVNGGPAGGQTMSVTLVHSPGASGNAEYDGTMWIESERTDDQNGGKYAVLTNIAYAKVGADAASQKLKMEIRNAEFNKGKVEAPYFGVDGKIDYNTGADAAGSFGPGQANDYVEGIGYFAFDINPSSYAGTISFWKNPGGNYVEPARGFLFESAQNADGTLSGCAYSGAVLDVSIRKAMKEALTLEPTGCFTPQLSFGACGSGNDNTGTQIWKQCFKQQANGYYVVDTSKVASSEGFDVIDLSGVKPTLPVVDVGAAGADGAVRE